MKRTFCFLIAVMMFATSVPIMAQLRMKSITRNGSPVKFMKEHPEYIYLNKPDEDCVTGFNYYISELLNPSGLGLNNNNYYIIIESFDHNEKPKALIWDGAIKQKLVKKMTTSNKRVVYFNNISILDEKNLLSFQGILEKYKYTIMCGLSSDGVSYARGKWQKHTSTGSITVFTNLSVKTDWSDNPSLWLSNKTVAEKSNNITISQNPETLSGTKGWFFDVKNEVSQKHNNRFAFSYNPEIQLWKDEFHSIPLNFCKMEGTELTFHPDMDRSRASFDNVIKLEGLSKPDSRQLYFMDQSVFADFQDVEKLPDGGIKMTAYYTVSLNGQMGKNTKGHILTDMEEAGSITLIIHKGEKDPRDLCPPHVYEMVSDNKTIHKSRNSDVSSPKSEHPKTMKIDFNNSTMEFVRQTNSDGLIYFIAQSPVDYNFWQDVYQGDNPFIEVELYNHNRSFNQVLDFIEKLNEETRKKNLAYSFCLPTFDELKAYYTTNQIYNDLPSYVDSIQIMTTTGKQLTLDQYRNLENKSEVPLFGSVIDEQQNLKIIPLNDSITRTQFYLKAIPDSQLKYRKYSSVMVAGLMKMVVYKCKKCGAEIYNFSRAKGKSLVENSKVFQEYSSDLNVFDFCNSLIRLQNIDLIRNKILEKGWRVYLEDKKGVTYKSSDNKYKLDVKKKNKKDVIADRIVLRPDNITLEEAFKAISELGYKCTDKKENCQSSYATSQGYQYDYYCYSDDDNHEVRVSAFTYKTGEKSVYVDFLK